MSGVVLLALRGVPLADKAGGGLKLLVPDTEKQIIEFPSPKKRGVD